MEAIINLLEQYGIAVVLCLLMAYFVKYMFDKFVSLLDAEQKAHKQEMQTVTEALKNNTIALQRLSDLINEQEDVA